MLQRIISIRNVGRFRRCVAAGDVTFRRFTIIFSENARGKTTLCAILRSLFTNTPAIIIGFDGTYISENVFAGDFVDNVSAFPDEDSLGEMIGKIRAAGPAHPLAAIHDELEELNEYARRYHHAPDGNEAIAQEPPRAAELEGYVRQTLRLVGCLW